MHEIVFESPFGEWRVRTSPPPVELAPFVDSFWETHGVVGYGYEKLLPSGLADFMVNLGPPQMVLQKPSDKLPVTHRHAWLSGIRDSPLYAAPAHGNETFMTHFVCASLRPEGVRQIFGVDAVDTAAQVIDAEDLLGSSVRTLRDRIGEAADTAGRFSALADFLRVQHQSRARATSEAAIWAMAYTLNHQGNVRIQHLCSELGISRKHLIELYKSAAGLSPKTFARLTRFRSVVARVQNPADTWVNIASEFGYFDQAHLIRDFNQFAGESPSSFLANRAPDGESVNYGEAPDQ